MSSGKKFNPKAESKSTIDKKKLDLPLSLGISKPLIIFGGFIVALIIFGPSYYFYSKYNQAQKKLSESTTVNKEEAKSLIAKVGKLIELPSGEEPTIATVSDKSSLPPQPFFAKAKNGDQLLIYNKAKKAFLYRPSTNKIIEVGPVTFQPTSSPSVSPTTTSSPQKSPTPSIADQITVAIYNASKIAGLAASTEARLKSNFKNISVVQKSNSQEDYTDSLVVDLSGKQKEAASRIAEYLNVETGPLPIGEVRPESDILVVVVN